MMRNPPIEVYRYVLRLKRPLRLKEREFVERRGLILKVGHEDGAAGFGEIAPLPGFSAETLEEATQAVLHWAEALTRSLDTQSASEDLLSFLVTAPSVLFGTECATMNYARQGREPSDRPSSRIRETVSLNGLVAGPIETAAARTEMFRTQGYRAVKVKMPGGPVSKAIDLIREVRRAAGADMALRLDANRIWDLDTALHGARTIADCAIEYIEEPVRNPADLATFAAKSGIPVALDETLLEAGEYDAPFFLERQWAVAAVLKPTLLGGILTCEDWAAEAQRFGIKPIVSSCFESGLGLIALAQLAASVTAEDIPVGLDTYEWLQEDVLERRFAVHEGGILRLDELAACADTVNTSGLERIYPRD